jgi:hypothetical protein
MFSIYFPIVTVFALYFNSERFRDLVAERISLNVVEGEGLAKASFIDRRRVNDDVVIN